VSESNYVDSKLRTDRYPDTIVDGGGDWQHDDWVMKKDGYIMNLQMNIDSKL
jgi:hypothetical protein